ncbi:MAG: UDP-N-acetylmuramate--L-alanine ligase [Sphingobacteriales bacterium]|nr:UDP-N-acetylmuramate--L-alanine ligase [Sphingobacteriales bacterium]
MQHVQTAYFIGIGGIGMSALARYFKRRGVSVSGYDRTPTPLTGELQREGIAIHYDENLLLIPRDVDLVVYTPAIPAHHAELSFYRENGYTVLKRSEVLEQLTHESFTIAIAGSHGKTTVTSMIAHLLTHSGYGCTAFVGGIMTNYNSNYIATGNNNVIVIEADEFDRSFLRLHPDIAVITAIDTDHLDIYGTKTAIEEAFTQFAQQIKMPEGKLIAQADIDILNQLENIVPQTFTYNNQAQNQQNTDFVAQNIRIAQNRHVFDIKTPTKTYYDISLRMNGLHNISNAAAAAAVATQLGISGKAIADALNSFTGIKRRFEYIIQNDDFVMIDDYAHHPEEIRALLNSVRHLYPKQRIVAVFQPHLFSRTRDLATEFAHALDLADEVCLLDIYPARELPIEGVSSDLIFNQLKCKRKHRYQRADVVQNIHLHRPEVLLTIGAGDIDALVEPLKNKCLSFFKKS